MNKLSEEKKVRIYEIRKSFIDKFSNWEQKIFYGILILIGTILLLISRTHPDYFFISIFVALALLTYVEHKSQERIHRLHSNLIKDIKNDKIDEIEKYDFWKFLNNKF